MQITSTKIVANQTLKFLIYGNPGVGKTTLAGTIGESTLLISAEAGLLSLAGKDIDVIDLAVDKDGKTIPKEKRLAELGKVLVFLEKPETQAKYKWIFIDSLTEISQNLVENLQLVWPDAKDGLKLWGDYAKKSRSLIKAFRDLPHYNVVFTALQTEDTDENNQRFIRADMQGKIGKQLPAYFDEVFWLHIEQGGTKRFLLTETREKIAAKDRSGKLLPIEAPNLNDIAAKIRGVKNANDVQTGSTTARKGTRDARKGSGDKPNVPVPVNEVSRANV